MTFANHLRTHQDAHNGGGEMPISYGSVCSGIEAATTAWHPLGWSPRWFAEIEPFPSAVLTHHWPDVPNLGDFTAIRDKIAEGAVEAPDVLVGGTPCQAFSIAGLRQSLDDKRGQLTIEFVRLADAIDSARSLGGKHPVTVVWENVPGILNTPDNAFGCFLAGLVGEDDPLEPPGGRWTNAGYVRGPRRAVAWRILDAQYFGVAQRRRRVFVVASAGGVRPEQVFFEFDGVRRDSPPSREAGQGASHDVARRTGERSHWDGGPHPSLNQSNNIGGVGMSNQEIFSQRGAYLAPHPVAPCLQAGGKAAGSATQQDAESGALVVQSFDGYNQNVGDVAQAIRANKSDGDHVGMVFYAATQHHGKVEACVAGPITRQQHQGITGDMPIVGHIQAVAATGDVFHTLRAEGFDASEDGTGRGVGAVVVGFNARQDPDSWEGRTGPLDTDGGTQAVAVRDISQTLTSNYGKQVDSSDTGLGPNVVFPAMQVRRLTPTECERLQGFPDGHTLIPWRGKPAEDCPDGPRYKALGNSMAVPVMRWIGARIARQLEAQA